MKNRYGWVGVAIFGVLTGGISAAVGYFAGRHAARLALQQSRREIQEQLDLLTERLDNAGFPAADGERPGAEEQDSVLIAATPSGTWQPATATDIPAETVAMIAAAVTAFLGKKVRVRSARKLQTPYEIVNPWTQQGRVVVHASHNVVQRQRRLT